MKTSSIRLAVVITLPLTVLAILPRTNAQTIYVADQSGSISTYDGSGTYQSGFSTAASSTSLYSFAMDSGYFYALNNSSGSVGKYTISGTLVDSALITGLSAPQAIAYYNGKLYVTNSLGGGNWAIQTYDTSGNLINASFITGIVQSTGMAFDGGYLYVTNFGASGSVGKYDATTGAAVDTAFITGLPYPNSIAISGSTIYLINGLNSGNGGIGTYDLATGATLNASFVTGLSNAYGIAVYGNELFSLNPSPGDNTLKVYDATTGAVINAALVTGLGNSRSLIVVPEPNAVVLIAGLSVFLIAMARKRTHRLP